MVTRDRHERQIAHFDTWAGQEFSKAVDRVLSRRGLSFWTDEQIALIRAEMIGRAWFSHKLNRENRKRRAA